MIEFKDHGAFWPYTPAAPVWGPRVKHCRNDAGADFYDLVFDVETPENGPRRASSKSVCGWLADPETGRIAAAAWPADRLDPTGFRLILAAPSPAAMKLVEGFEIDAFEWTGAKVARVSRDGNTRTVTVSTDAGEDLINLVQCFPC